MKVKLNILTDNKGARKKRTIVGRGIGSGKGKTCGRGVKGQKSRTGTAIGGFEGGQMPIYRRLPKRGFNNHSRTVFQAVNVELVQDFIDRKKLDASKQITKEALLKARVIKTLNNPVKLLGTGKLTSKIDIAVDAASASALEIVNKAGGKVTILEKKKRKAGPKSEKSKAAPTA